MDSFELKNLNHIGLTELLFCYPEPYRYFVRVTIQRRLADVVKEQDIWVHSYVMPSDGNNSIKMEVGIEDCLHIEFEYNKSRYSLFLSNCILSCMPNHGAQSI